MFRRVSQNRQKSRKHPLELLLKDFEQSGRGRALRITVIYLVAGLLWVFVSDSLVENSITSPRQLMLWSVSKGWLFVLLSCLLIYRLVLVALRRAKESETRLSACGVRLEVTDAILTAMIESSPEIVAYSLDTQLRYIAFNQKHQQTVRETTGRAIRAGMCMPDTAVTSAETDRTRELLGRALAGERFSLIDCVTRPGGPNLYWHTYYAPIRSAAGRVLGLSCIAINVTGLREAKEENLYLTFHDRLTGLFNRRFCEQVIPSIDIEQNLPISVLIGDLNGLKLINDAFGHAAGDELLQMAARVMERSCRPEDIACRWGGDEFILLMPNTDAARAQAVVRHAGALAGELSIRSVGVSFSFGWATKETPDQDIRTVLRGAEDFMLKHKIAESSSMRNRTIKTIITTLHEKNPREEEHSERVGSISRRLGLASGIPEIEAGMLELAGYLHDIGKIAIGDEILNKPGKLTPEEREVINRHPEIGCRIIRSSYEISEIADAILCHHERWDGNGYPKGLKGAEIPLYARIITIADCYDAMTRMRPYKSVLTTEQAAQDIRENAGKQFDPVMAKIFIEKVLELPWQI